ncbi:class I SAM-dependent methyltransferase [Streptomyces sp. NPDC060223]|uniref:class I SAM-dependent methyltransferase n=1 Tax=unclassified Streptomyces TaxID=2593676 RepID=UPI0036257D1D
MRRRSPRKPSARRARSTGISRPLGVVLRPGDPAIRGWSWASAFARPGLPRVPEFLPNSQRAHYVPAGLREDWEDALPAAGFDRSEKTVWITEGALPCLQAIPPGASTPAAL